MPVSEPDLTNAAVGLVSVRREGDTIVQTIRSVYGGPAYSLSSMMGQAKGVCGVSISSADGLVTGEVRTRALVHVTVVLMIPIEKGAAELRLPCLRH